MGEGDLDHRDDLCCLGGDLDLRAGLLGEGGDRVPLGDREWRGERCDLDRLAQGELSGDLCMRKMNIIFSIIIDVLKEV